METELKAAIATLWRVLEEDDPDSSFEKDGGYYRFVKHPHYVEIISRNSYSSMFFFFPEEDRERTVGMIGTMRYLKEGPTFKTAKRNFIHWWRHHKDFYGQ